MMQGQSTNEQDRDIELLKLPPHSMEAEQAVLGGLLIDNEAMDRIDGLLSREDFYADGHRHIFERIQQLIGEGKAADVITVAEALESVQKLDYVGGLAYIGALAQNVPTSANIGHYAKIVRERSVLRQLVSAAGKIADGAYNPLGRSAAQVLDEAETDIMRIAEQDAHGQKQFVKIGEVLNGQNGSGGVVDQIALRAENPSEVIGVPTGFYDLDKLTSGFQEGDLIIVAGRPSMGKTAFALNIAEHVALHANLPVAVFSMEMSSEQLAMRMLGSVSRLPFQSLRIGRLQNSDWNKLSDALEHLTTAPILIDETPALTASGVRSRARRLKRQYKNLGLIIVDYLQLMQASTSGENRATEISEISRSLKALAKELHVPVVALSQLNRSVEQRDNKRPIMSDLRESGAIEQDADVILFIYREEVYKKNDPQVKGEAEIIIGKQRNGPIDTVKLTYLGEYTRFENRAAADGYPQRYGG